MAFFMTFLSNIFFRYFAWLHTKFGLQMAINLSLATAWIVQTVAFTGIARNCLSASGSCGQIIGNGTSNFSDWVKFGFSLVPSEAINIILCLISLHTAGFAMVTIWTILSIKFKTS